MAAMAFLQGEADGTFRSAVLLDTLLDLGLLMGLGLSVTRTRAMSCTWSLRGLAPSMTGEWLLQGTAVETIAGTVTMIKLSGCPGPCSR